MAEDTSAIVIDETYEFSAPRWFDFVNGETEEDVRSAELWFNSAVSHAPSPFMPKIKGRFVAVGSLCDFSEAKEPPKLSESLNSTLTDYPSEKNLQSEELLSSQIKEEEARPKEAKKDHTSCPLTQCPKDERTRESNEEKLASFEEIASCSIPAQRSSVLRIEPSNVLEASTAQACTPKSLVTSQRSDKLTSQSSKNQTARKTASLIRNPSTLKPKNQSQLSQNRSLKLDTAKKDKNVKSIAATFNLAQENQAIKRQKLEEGKTRQILNVKPQTFPHKSRHGLVSCSSNLLQFSAAKIRREERKIYVREPAVAPFVSMAEMMRKFQSSTRDLSFSGMNGSLSHGDAISAFKNKPKLTLTRPKEPDLETAQRFRPVRIKSSAELEEEMMAKIPKFKARPLNKKILEAPTLPALPRSIPQLPEFQEFNLETMARANQNAETSTVASAESSQQNHQWRPHLTEPKIPVLQTSLRARPPRVKSSSELELEELEKVPKFKARPFNKKIFESKGDLGMFCNMKKQVTVPQEFHFATDERIPSQNPAVADLFDKLSLDSEPRHDQHHIPRITTPNPFSLYTEARGAEKERKLAMELMEKQLEEERGRIPKANPYPYTTDYPVIPPKPEAKHCTKPEPFQLESLVRHEEEMQKEMEERQRKEKEEAEMRKFKAQPILKEDPIPLPDKARKPLTEVEEFNFHADFRAVERGEFDKKVKEKEMMYKRYRDENEAARMMEEEKALKQLRRTLVPHAKPLPKFENPFIPQKSSRETTKAKSPKLRVIQRNERRKKASPYSAVSSAAANMR